MEHLYIRCRSQFRWVGFPDFPHGNSCTESKRYETELACRDGAVEIDMVVNNYKGATAHDLALMRACVSARVQVKAAGGARDFDGLIMVRELGCSRCGATATAAMMDEFRRREAAGGGEIAGGGIGSGGY